MPQRYKKVQFIAFCIHTAPALDLITNKKIYVGLDNPVDDINARCSLVEQVIKNAWINSQRDDETLQIFMMPEFFFRGNRGAYDMDVVQDLIQKLQDLVKEDKWKNWLFVFGSIVGFSSPDPSPPSPPPSRPPSPPPSDGPEAYNFSLVQKGGFGDNVQKRIDTARVVLKELLSKKGITDFVAQANSIGGLVLERVIYLQTMNAPAPGREIQKLNYDGLGVFEMDWITFGLELCLDHAAQRLRNSPQPVGAHQIQIQLVPSCGMSIKDESTVACRYGFIFNCDGYANYTTGQLGFHSELKQVDVMYTQGNNAVNSPEINTFTDYPVNINIANIFATGFNIEHPPKIRVYTPKAIPATTVVA